jgi:hypothetical protein
MNNEFVTYEQASALKELGYGGKCLGWYSLFDQSLEIGNIRHSFYVLAPLKQQVFRWFREKYRLHTVIDETVRPQILNEDGKLLFEYTSNKKYAGFQYEEAENACIDKLIEITKQQNNGMEINN